jgi:ligand-binding SRPBCC domain-containing protein
MKQFTLQRTTRLNISITEAWSFFANPQNLSRITPPEMKFKVLTKELPQKIYTGLLIDYTVVPLFGIPLHWTTEIKNVEHPFFFADEQKAGPYAYWRHEHRFKADGNITVMNDEVMYALPLGFIGRLAHGLIVEDKLRDVFNFRGKAIKEIFPGSTIIV